MSWQFNFIKYKFMGWNTHQLNVINLSSLWGETRIIVKINVESTLFTLIQRRNNVVYPVGC